MYKKIYLSGKISGLTFEEAMSLFEKAEKEALQYAHEVCNPMKLLFEKFQPKDPNDITWGEYMVNDLDAIINEGVDSLYMLDNWRDSRGARIEHFTACEMPLPIIYQDPKTFCSWGMI